MDYETISTDNFSGTILSASEMSTNELGNGSFHLLKSLDLELLPRDTWFHRCVYFLNNLEEKQSEKSLKNEFNGDEQNLVNIQIVNDSIAIMKKLTYKEKPTDCLFSKKFEFLNQLTDVLSEEEHVEENKLLLVKLLKILEVHRKKLQGSKCTQRNVKHQHSQTSCDEQQDSSTLDNLPLDSCTNIDVSNPFLSKSKSIVNSTEILMGDNTIKNGTKKSKMGRKRGRQKKNVLNKTEPIINITGRVLNKSEQNINKSNGSKENGVLALKDSGNKQTKGTKRKLETSQSNKNIEDINSETVQRRRSERIRTQVPKKRWTLSCVMIKDTKENRKLYKSLFNKKKRSNSVGDKSKIQNSTINSNTSGEQSTILHKKRKLYSVEDWVAGMLEKF